MKWMVLCALGRMDIQIKKIVDENIVQDVFIICQNLRHVQEI